MLRSGNHIGLTHRKGPENDVAKRQLTSGILAPYPYANLDTMAAGFVEGEVDVDGVYALPFRLKTGRAELPLREGIDKECMPSGLQ